MALINFTKASVELYLSESLERAIDTSDGKFVSKGDSMLKERNLFQKLKLMIQFCPAFLTTIAYKVGGASIIAVFLLNSSEYGAIYVAIQAGINFIVAFSFLPNNTLQDRIHNAFFYGWAPLILARGPFDSRKESHPKMIAANILSLIPGTICLTGIMFWFFALKPSTHPPNWSYPSFTFHDKPGLLAAVTSGTLLLGLISTAFIWRLKHQVKTIASKEGKLESYWGVDSNKPVLKTIDKIQPTDPNFTDF